LDLWNVKTNKQTSYLSLPFVMDSQHFNL